MCNIIVVIIIIIIIIIIITFAIALGKLIVLQVKTNFRSKYFRLKFKHSDWFIST